MVLTNSRALENGYSW